MDDQARENDPLDKRLEAVNERLAAAGRLGDKKIIDESRAQKKALEAVMSKRLEEADFTPSLHPRGRGGRFIETFADLQRSLKANTDNLPRRTVRRDPLGTVTTTWKDAPKSHLKNWNPPDAARGRGVARHQSRLVTGTGHSERLSKMKVGGSLKIGNRTVRVSKSPRPDLFNPVYTVSGIPGYYMTAEDAAREAQTLPPGHIGIKNKSYDTPAAAVSAALAGQRDHAKQMNADDSFIAKQAKKKSHLDTGYGGGMGPVPVEVALPRRWKKLAEADERIEERLREAGWAIESDPKELDEIIMSPLAASRITAGKARGGGDIHFNPKLHPRDRVGRFRAILGQLSGGHHVALPGGISVRKKRVGKGFEVRDANGIIHASANVDDIVERALRRSAALSANIND